MNAKIIAAVFALGLVSMQVLSSCSGGGSSGGASAQLEMKDGGRFLLSEETTINAPGDLAGAASLSWEQVEGSGELNIGTPSTASTSISSSKEGAFQLRLTADDSVLVATIVWDTSAPEINLNKTLTANEEVEYTADVTDASELTVKWTSDSDKVEFGSDDSLTTTLSATEDGTYTLTLTVEDELEQSSTADMTFIWDESFALNVTVSGLKADLTLTENESDEDLAVTEDGNFAFTTRVKPGTDYAVVASDEPNLQNCTVTDGSGTMPEAEVTVSVSCAIKTFTKNSTVSDAITTNASGDTDIILHYSNSSGEQLRIFRQDDGTNLRLLAQTNDGSGWSAFENVSPSGIHAINPQAAISDNGDIIISYLASSSRNVYISHRDDGIWSHAPNPTVYISPVCGGFCSITSTDIDKDGNILLMYNRSSNGSNLLYSSYDDATDNWNHEHNSILSIGLNVGPWKADFNKHGYGVVAFQFWDGSNQQVFRFERVGGTFVNIPTMASQHFTPDGRNASPAEVHVSDNGDAIITYYQSNTANNTQAFVSERTNGTWNDPTDYDTDQINLHPLSDIWAAMNANGNVIIGYTTSGASDDLYARTRIDGTWSSASPNLAQEDQNHESILLGIDSDNNAVVSFMTDGASKYHIYAAQYSYGDWYLPSGVADGLHFGSTSVDDPDDPTLWFTADGEARIYYSAIVDGVSDYEMFSSTRE